MKLAAAYMTARSNVRICLLPRKRPGKMDAVESIAAHAVSWPPTTLLRQSRTYSSMRGSDRNLRLKLHGSHTGCR